MAQFSAKERFIASILSSTPRLKAWIKKAYVAANYLVYRKGYKYKICDNRINEIRVFSSLKKGCETFFGYYDKSPEIGNGMVIFNETELKTHKKPSSLAPICINVMDRLSGEVIKVGESLSYNWQQGCRAHWIDNNRLIYNSFDNKSQKYKSVVYDISCRSAVDIYDYPVQDSYQDIYFLSINYERIMALRPDYGYRNLPLLNEKKLKDTDEDGIRMIDFNTKEDRLIVKLSELVGLMPKESFKGALHKVNHVMISPNGDKFIFIHRWYQSGRRFDRLILSDFNNLQIISDDDMVSHMCWIDEETLFGYLRHNGVNGFYFINLSTGEFRTCERLNSLQSGDGHPSCHGDWIVVDTYPDKSRQQHLTLYNIRTDKAYPLLELFQSLAYQGECRCDLHPRFSSDGLRIYFDTVFNGFRELACIDVSGIVCNQ